jgi:hypothetical protein
MAGRFRNLTELSIGVLPILLSDAAYRAKVIFR